MRYSDSGAALTPFLTAHISDLSPIASAESKSLSFVFIIYLLVVGRCRGKKIAKKKENKFEEVNDDQMTCNVQFYNQMGRVGGYVGGSVGYGQEMCARPLLPASKGTKRNSTA